MAKRKPKFEKFQIAADRRGTMRFDDAYNAPDAAKVATRFARQGYTTEVQRWSATRRKTVMMTCTPAVKGSKTVAVCTIKPAFKKAILRR